MEIIDEWLVATGKEDRGNIMNVNYIELIGIAATCAVLLSFLFNDSRKIRYINMVGCVLFVVYGVFIHSWSVTILNGVVFFVHIYKLLRSRKDDT